MFNGLIREIGVVESFSGSRLRLKANHRPNLGDSIAINGACLSVVSTFEGGFEVELSSESVAVLATENFKNRVHIEPAMQLGMRVDGHLLQGHIDALGIIREIKKLSSGVDFIVEIPKNIAHLVANKGAIAVEGVSLTVSEISGNKMRLTLIPLSLKDTIFGEFKVGRRVNIETDILARYVERILSAREQSALSWGEADFYASIY